MDNMPPTIRRANDTELTGTPNAPNEPKPSGAANNRLEHISGSRIRLPENVQAHVSEKRIIMDKTQTHLGKPTRWFQHCGWSVYLLLIIVPVAAFWQCLTLPFVQDDWGLLWTSQTHDIISLLRSFFDFKGALMYRPAGLTYLVLLFKAFGEMAWPCHVLALCIHVLNSVMVFRIMRRLTEDQTIAVICSLIYASAVAVHLDPLCWAVGIYDLGGAFFFFTSIALFLSGRTFLSVLAFLVGTLFKESTVVLPVVLVAIQLTRLENWGLKDIKSLAWRLLPHFVVLIFVLGVKMLTGMSPLALPASHPYVFEPFGVHVVQNAYRYGGWMLQAFLPFGRINTMLFRFILNDLIVLAVLVVILQRAKSARLLLGFALWILLSLLPVLFMPNHTFRYYATYALPAFICAVLVVVQDVITLLDLRQYKNIILVCVGSCSICISIVQSNRIFTQGPNAGTLQQDGANGLVRRAHFVELVRRQLLQQLPKPVDGATILLGDVDLWAFNKDSGPRVWYKTVEMEVYDLKDLRRDGLGLYIENPAQSQVGLYTGSRHERIAIHAE